MVSRKKTKEVKSYGSVVPIFDWMNEDWFNAVPEHIKERLFLLSLEKQQLKEMIQKVRKEIKELLDKHEQY